MKNEMNAIASKTLGDSTSYAVYTDTFDKTLLNPMPRSLARSENNIQGTEFSGYDVWHCYEATFLTDLGHPISGVLKIVYPSDTLNMVESKSMKLFLNSFDMCKMGTTVDRAIKNYIGAVRQSLNECLDEYRVEVNFFRHVDILSGKVKVVENKFVRDSQYYDITVEDQADIDINEVYEDNQANYIYKNDKEDRGDNYLLMFESMRSRCRHTKQKDTGTAIVYMNRTHIEPYSIYKQINSMRETNEFHEFCAERLWRDISEQAENMVCVALLYTRRGSLDINPVRYCKEFEKQEIKNYYFKDFIDVNVLTLPTIIQ